MYKFILSCILLVLSTSALSCAMPRGGEAYNSLIVVERLEQGQFKIVAPQNAKGLEYGASFSLAYHKIDAPRSPEHMKDLEVTKIGENYEAVFKPENIKGYTPFVLVFWEPEKCCLCGAYGYSKDLSTI